MDREFPRIRSTACPKNMTRRTLIAAAFAVISGACFGQMNIDAPRKKLEKRFIFLSQEDLLNAIRHTFPKINILYEGPVRILDIRYMRIRREIIGILLDIEVPSFISLGIFEPIILRRITLVDLIDFSDTVLESAMSIRSSAKIYYMAIAEKETRKKTADADSYSLKAQQSNLRIVGFD